MSFTQMNQDDDDIDGHNKENSPLFSRSSPLNRTRNHSEYDSAMGEFEVPPPESNEEGLVDSEEDHNPKDQQVRRFPSIEVSGKPRSKPSPSQRINAKREPAPKKKQQSKPPSKKKSLNERRINIRELECK
jgi:hypothetical protein